MLWQLVKFKIRTTFGKSTIIGYVISFIILISYSLSISHAHIPSSAIYELDIVGIFLLSLNFILNGIYSSFFIQKSDIDFLYMLPLDERQLEIAYSISAFLINLLQTIIAAALLFPAISYLSILVALVSTIMNSFAFFAFKRKIIVAVIGAWMLSSLLKFPFSPFSMVFGYVYGYFILSVLFTITVLLGIRNASVEDLILEFYKRQGLTPSKATTSISLYSSSPLMAMLKRNFNFIEIGGRINLGGIPYIINKRIKIYKILSITVAIGILNIGISLIKAHISSIALSIIENNILLFPGVFLVLFTSQAAFVNEPLWLNLSVMTPTEFARKYLLVKTLSLFIVFLPISISAFLINPLMGIGGLFIPLVYIYGASVNARFYQVRMSQTPSYDARVIIGSLLFFVAAIAIELDSILPIFGLIPTLVGVIVTLAFTLPFLFSRGYWEKTFEKAITSV